MTLHIKDSKADRLARELAEATGETLTEAVTRALEERLAPERVARLGLFNPDVTTRLVTEHLMGLRDHRKVLWALLMFDAWRERYLPSARWS